jgi:tetratricopeptide (TPR) repeat protein
MAAWKGADDKQAIIFHARIGEFLVESGRPLEALAILEADLARCDKQGCDPGDSVSMRVHLSQAYIAAGKPAAGIPQLEALADDLAREHVWSNRRLNRVHVALAEAHVAAGNVAEAQAALDRIPELSLRTLPPRHPFLALYRRVQGLIWLKQGRPDQAHAALTEAADIFGFRYGTDNWRTRRAAEELQRAARGRGT